jgi:hypothetical protein
MLQAGSSWVRLPMRSLDFSIDLILPAALCPLGPTQSLTEISTSNLPGFKGWPARIRLTNSPPSVSLDVSKPYGPTRPVTGRALPFFNLQNVAV